MVILKIWYTNVAFVNFILKKLNILGMQLIFNNMIIIIYIILLLIYHFSFHMRTHENKEGNYKQTDYTVTNTLVIIS